jgi:hypothetical protein
MFEILVDNTVKEKNKKEWERINNLWLEVKNNHKSQNPNLYDTESDNSDDGTSTKPYKELKRADSSYDELLFAHDCIITEKNEIECDSPLYDGIEDSKTHFTSSSNDNDNDNNNDNENAYNITMYDIKKKYTIENSYMLEMDYSINYNMKMLTHIASYYNIIKNNNNGLGIVILKGKEGKDKEEKTKKTKKFLKPDLIKEIILFETNYENHDIVLKFRKMLEKIDALKKDKYFSSFILFS